MNRNCVAWKCFIACLAGEGSDQAARILHCTHKVSMDTRGPIKGFYLTKQTHKIFCFHGSGDLKDRASSTRFILLCSSDAKRSFCTEWKSYICFISLKRKDMLANGIYILHVNDGFERKKQSYHASFLTNRVLKVCPNLIAIFLKPLSMIRQRILSWQDMPQFWSMFPAPI